MYADVVRGYFRICVHDFVALVETDFEPDGLTVIKNGPGVKPDTFIMYLLYNSVCCNEWML